MKFGKTLLTFITAGTILTGCGKEIPRIQETTDYIINKEILPEKYTWSFESIENGTRKRVVRDSNDICIGYLEFLDLYKECVSVSGNLRESELYAQKVSNGEIIDYPQMKFTP
ncbi:MAG: hypothetical protein AABW50_04155 [Nanoarchaeota archaeon]